MLGPVLLNIGANEYAFECISKRMTRICIPAENVGFFTSLEPKLPSSERTERQICNQLKTISGCKYGIPYQLMHWNRMGLSQFLVVFIIMSYEPSENPSFLEDEM